MRPYLSPGITEHPCDVGVIRQSLDERKGHVVGQGAMLSQRSSSGRLKWPERGKRFVSRGLGTLYKYAPAPHEAKPPRNMAKKGQNF